MTMLHRILVKRHIEFFALFILAASFFLLLFRNWLDLQFSNNLTVSEESHDGACQQPEPEVMEWDSSRVLLGPPTERFRGMLSRQFLIIHRIQLLSRQPS